MGITAPDGIQYPDSDSSFTPLYTYFAALAQSTQDAITGLRGATAPPVGSAAARNALYPTPVQGNSVLRLDLGYTERYFGEYSAGGNPGGATPAGWYPTSGSMPAGVMKRTSTACAFGNATYAVMSQNAYWSSTATGAHIGGGMTYNDGFVIPVSGVYRVGLSTFTTSGGGAQYAIGVGVNAAISPGGDKLIAFHAVPTALPAMGGSGTQDVRLTVGDKLNIWGYAAGVQGISPAPSTGPTFTCVYVGPPQG